MIWRAAGSRLNYSAGLVVTCVPYIVVVTVTCISLITGTCQIVFGLTCLTISACRYMVILMLMCIIIPIPPTIKWTGTGRDVKVLHTPSHPHTNHEHIGSSEVGEKIKDGNRVDRMSVRAPHAVI